MKLDRHQHQLLKQCQQENTKLVFQPIFHASDRCGIRVIVFNKDKRVDTIFQLLEETDDVPAPTIQFGNYNQANLWLKNVLKENFSNPFE